MLNLTIKQKIIFGFSAIGLLLLTASSFFYHSLNKISDANNNVETLAVPVQKQSVVLQIQLLKMMQQAAVAYTQTDVNKLKESLKRFNQLQTQYSKTGQLLLLKVSDHAQMKSALTQAQSQYQQYLSQIQTMFSAKIDHQQAIQAYQNNYQAFDDSRFQASSNMLDLEIVDASGQEKLLDEVIGTGSRIDDALYTLGNTMSGLSRTEQLDLVNKHQEVMVFLLIIIDTNFTYLVEKAAPLPAKKLLDDFKSNFTTVQQSLDQPGRLYQLQRQTITLREEAEKAYFSANESVNLTYEKLDELVSVANKRFVSFQLNAQYGCLNSI